MVDPPAPLRGWDDAGVRVPQPGKTDEGLLEKERLFVGLDGEVYHDHVLVDKETIVDILESDEAPEEIRGEIIYDDSG